MGIIQLKANLLYFFKFIHFSAPRDGCQSLTPSPPAANHLSTWYGCLGPGAPRDGCQSLTPSPLQPTILINGIYASVWELQTMVVNISPRPTPTILLPGIDVRFWVLPQMVFNLSPFQPTILLPGIDA